MEKGRYIVIEGPIGVGKTSLVNLLASASRRSEYSRPPTRTHSSRASTTTPSATPSRRSSSSWSRAFASSRNSRSKISSSSPWSAIISSTADRIFAYLNLDDNELSLYEQIYGLLKARIVAPDVVIYLQASTDVLVERIAKRGRAYEKHLSRQYLEELSQAYNHFFFHYSATPLLVINTNVIDFVKNPGDLDDLANQISTRRRDGVLYAAPLGEEVRRHGGGEGYRHLPQGEEAPGREDRHGDRGGLFALPDRGRGRRWISYWSATRSVKSRSAMTRRCR